MATSRVAALRTTAAIVALAVVSWVGYETVHAGNDIPPPQPQALTKLSGGSASDKRIDGKSWSLDYDSATMSADGSSAEIENIHDGLITRNGKPYMRVRAKHITADLTANDFTVTGPVTFAEIGGQHRSLQTIGAHYFGYGHTLVLSNRTTIRQGPIRIVVDHVTVNFVNGSTTFGRISGSMRGR